MSCQLSKDQVKKMVEQYGSPLYIFHANEFEKNYLSLLNTFRSIYPKYNIAYSYKTNYTPRICQFVKKLGGIAEVVSEMEYHLAKKIGYDSEYIMYNGPIKGDGLFEHLLEGGVANIDNLDEMRGVVSFAKEKKDKVFKLAFRVNIDVGQGFVSRFGLDSYEDDKKHSELDEAFEMARAEKNIRVVGLHCHVGRARNIRAWEKRVKVMFALVDRYFQDPPEFIDFGSGMNSIMEPELARQFSGSIPMYEEYAAVVATGMKNKYGSLPYERQPYLYTEPGTTVISGYMSFLGTVKSIKKVKEKMFITFDCSGGNMGDICHLKQLPITIYHQGGDLVDCKDASFVGYTCLEHDRIYEGFNGKLAVDDIVQFRNIGSYSNVFKPPFILPNCAMIQFDENGQMECVKQKETIDDIFKTYVF